MATETVAGSVGDGDEAAVAELKSGVTCNSHTQADDETSTVQSPAQQCLPVTTAAVNAVANAVVGAAVSVPDPLTLADPARDERWAVLYTYSRREKLVARACEYLGVRHYLPLYEHHTGTMRRRSYFLPLFPGYLFACLDHESRTDVLQSGAVFRLIWPGRQDVLLSELRQIRTALEASVDLVVGPVVEKGALVRVVNGPLTGVEGLVKSRRRRGRRERLLLNVSILGRSVSTEIDLRDVERVGKARCIEEHGLTEVVAC